MVLGFRKHAARSRIMKDRLKGRARLCQMHAGIRVRLFTDSVDNLVNNRVADFTS